MRGLIEGPYVQLILSPPISSEYANPLMSEVPKLMSIIPEISRAERMTPTEPTRIVLILPIADLVW
jgi:hypothetical protein